MQGKHGVSNGNINDYDGEKNIILTTFAKHEINKLSKESGISLLQFYMSKQNMKFVRNTLDLLL